MEEFEEKVKYEKIKEYENFVLYKNCITGVKECFFKSDLKNDKKFIWAEKKYRQSRSKEIFEEVKNGQ